MSKDIERFASYMNLLHGFVSGLELILRKAEDLKQSGQLGQDRAKNALPFLTLIWLYSTGIRDILHAERPDGQTLWNSPAVAALARPVLDAFLSLIFFSIEETSTEEYEFRQLLLSRHAVFKRLDMLQRADQNNAEIARECASAAADWDNVNQVVLNHPHMNLLEADIRKQVAKKGDNYRPVSDNILWERSGLPTALYDVSFRYLSQYAHATPYAAVSLRYHQADTDDGALNMNVPLGLVVSCLTVALRYTGSLHPELHALLPDAFLKFSDG